MFRKLHPSLTLLFSIVIFIFFSIYYSLGVSPSVFSADSGEFLTAIISKGIPHPPSYPLYVILGIILSYIPVPFSLAFKIGLLSSFLVSGSIAIMFVFSDKITKSYLSSLVAVATYGFLYPILIYGRVAEVFSLVSFFASVLILSSYIFFEKLKSKRINSKSIFWFSFIFGLSLTAHQIFLLFIPSFFLLFLPFRNLIFKKAKNVFFMLSGFILGFSIYIYVPIAASFKPFINWDNAINFPNFFRLITKADYGGTFNLSAVFTFADIKQRILQMWSELNFFYIDWTLLGVILLILGIIAFKKINFKFWVFMFSLLIITGPFFAFYAIMPLMSSFTLGIFERFLLLPYVVATPFLAFGLTLICREIGILFNKTNVKLLSKMIFLLPIIFLVLPLKIAIRNFDRTNFSNFYLGNKFGEDILKSAEPNSIVILEGDAELFNTWYVYLSKIQYRTMKLKLIPVDLLPSEGFIQSLQINYPELLFPKKRDRLVDWANFTAERYHKKYKIYSTNRFITEKESFRWIPSGMLWQLTDKPIATSSVKFRSIKLLSEFDKGLDVKEGLKENFLVSDIIQKYGLAHAGFADFLLDQKLYPDAEKEFRIALKLAPFVYNLHYNLGTTLSVLGKCEEAEKEILIYRKMSYDDEKSLTALVVNAKDCFKSKTREIKYKGTLEEFKKNKSIKLRDL